MAYGLYVYVINSPGTVDSTYIPGFASSSDAETAGDAIVAGLQTNINKVQYVVVDDVSSTITPGDGSVDTAQLADDSVTIAKLADAVVARLLPGTLGTAGQVLAVNAGADGVEWVTLP